MKTDYNAIGKWLAVVACIVMGGVLVLNNKADQASGFALGAVLLVIFA